MAYFSNSSDGAIFDEQCGICKYGDDPCPIAYVQMIYNYDQCKNQVAKRILNDLVSDAGECQMFKMCKKDFFDGGEKQLDLGL